MPVYKMIKYEVDGGTPSCSFEVRCAGLMPVVGKAIRSTEAKRNAAAEMLAKMKKDGIAKATPIFKMIPSAVSGVSNGACGKAY